MKKLITFLFALMIIVSSKAAIYLDDTFDYDLGTLVGQGDWVSSGTITTGTGRTVISGNLAYSDAGGTYALSGKGKIVFTDISSASNYFVVKRFNASDISTGNVYLSFLFQAGANQTQGNADLVALSNFASTGDSNSGAPRVWVGKGNAANTFRFGTTRYSTTGGDIVWGSQEFSNADYTNAVFFIVLKYDATAKKTYLYVNPVVGSTSEPADAYAEAQEGSSTRNVCNVLLRANGSTVCKFNIGGLRVSSSWTEAVAAASEATTEATLTLQQPAEGGSLAADPDQTTFNINEEVTITAIPTGNYVLKNFVVNGTDTPATSENTLVLTMDGNKTVTAVLEDPTAITEWIINPARGSNTTLFSTANGFVKKSDRTTVGVPKDGDIVYVESGRVLGLNSATTVVSVVSEDGGSIIASGGCTLASLSMTNSTFSVTGLTGTRTITINDTFNAEGDNVFDVGGTMSASTYLSIGANGSSGSPNVMKMTGSGTITKKGAVQLVLSPSTDLNETTFSGKWIVEEGEIWSRSGSSADKRADFFPGAEIEVDNGGTYRIDRMYAANGFISGNLSGQKITVKEGGILDIDPLTTNNINVLQTITIETGGTFNANAATGTATLTLGGDLTLFPGAIFNVYYGATDGNVFKVNNTIFEAIQTSSGLTVPIVTYGDGALMPVYTGNITFDIAFESGQNTADISPLFTNVPSSYTSDILMTYPATTVTGDYTVQLPTIAKADGVDETWILYDNGVQKVDLSQENNSYQFAVPGADMAFKWDVSTLAPSTVSLTLEQPAEGGSLAADPDQTTFDINDEVTITATLAANYELKNFVVNGTDTPATSENTLVLTMDEDKTVTAVFELITGINNPTAAKGAIVSEKYYTLTGVEIQKPATGMLIKKVVYDNGVVETTKVFKKINE